MFVDEHYHDIEPMVDADDCKFEQCNGEHMDKELWEDPSEKCDILELELVHHFLEVF